MTASTPDQPDQSDQPAPGTGTSSAPTSSAATSPAPTSRAPTSPAPTSPASISPAPAPAAPAPGAKTPTAGPIIVRQLPQPAVRSTGAGAAFVAICSLLIAMGAGGISVY